MRIHRLHTARAGFTLVEILVVLGIMIVLMSLAVVVASSGIIDNHRLSAGADRVSGWLLQARSKAFRDRLPRGVRFIPDAAGYVREAQFIEVPEPFVPNPTDSDSGYKLAFRYTERNLVPGPGTYIAKEVYIIREPGTPMAELVNLFTSEVGNGDTLKLPGFATLHKVLGFTPTPNYTVIWQGAPTPFNALKINLNPDPAIVPPQVDTPRLPELGFNVHVALNDLTPQPFQYMTKSFAFLRQARPMLGEQPLRFSANTAVQIVAGDSSQESLTSMSIIPNINGNYDVLFSPTGEVMNAGFNGRVVLWMRNPDFAPTSFAARNANVDDRAAFERAGEMALITVYCKTGAVATHPVQLPPATATNSATHVYQFTKDGVASGI